MAPEPHQLTRSKTMRYLITLKSGHFTATPIGSTPYNGMPILDTGTSSEAPTQEQMKAAWHQLGMSQAMPQKAAMLASLRSRRNALLTESDWTQLPDSPLTSEKRADWAAYREVLRNLPEQASPVWPSPPSF